MPNAPRENNEHFRDADPGLQEAAAATPEQSKAALLALLEAKDKRVQAMNEPEDPRQREQLPIVRQSIDARLELMKSMVA